MSRPPENLAQRLRIARRRRGFTQAQLAERVGMGQSDVSKIELGTIQQTTGLARFAQALDVSPAWLELGDGPEPDWTDKALDLQPVHAVSLQTATVSPPRIEWGDLVKLTTTTRRFEVAVTDDAMAPDVRAGTVVTLARDLVAQPGDGVLVIDGRGQHHLRLYHLLPGDRWEARAINGAYPTLQSDQEGLEIVAVLEAVHQRWSTRR